MVAVNTAPFSSLGDWKEYRKSKEAADVTWATDIRGELVKQYRVFSLGTTVIIDREGRIAYRDDVATPYEILESQVEPLL